MILTFLIVYIVALAESRLVTVEDFPDTETSDVDKEAMLRQVVLFFSNPKNLKILLTSMKRSD